LVVDDFAPFRQFLSSALQDRSDVEIVSEACDGIEAIERTQEFYPELVLLDIGIPKLNGIEAAQRIRVISPDSRILFISQESSADIVQKALATGAHGYVVKSDAGRELLGAVDAVVRGEHFLSSMVLTLN